jgi:hypothetical protein
MREATTLVLAILVGLVVYDTSLGGPPAHTGTNVSAPNPGGHAYGLHDTSPNPPGRALGLRDQAPGLANDHDGHAFGANGFHPWWKNTSTTGSIPPGHAFGKNGNRPWWRKLFGQ